MSGNVSTSLCVVVMMKLLVIANCCEENMYESGGKCVDSCPPGRGLLQVEFTSTCTTNCPASSPYLYTGTVCITYCPDGYTIRNNECSLVRDVRMANAGNPLKCPPNFCPSPRPFCFDLQCKAHCPEGMVTDQFDCVFTCAGDSPYTFNSTCINECPINAKFIEGNRCVDLCSPDTYMHNTSCVSRCPPGMFVFNRTCMTKCPETYPKSITFGNMKRCLETCPAFTVTNGSVCDIDCPEDAMFHFNRTCLSACPSDFPFIWIKHDSLYDKRIPICVNSCPDNLYIDVKTCVQKCDSKFILNSTCVDSCPQLYNDVYSRPYACVSECHGLYKYDKTCVAYCPSYMFLSESTCMFACPLEMPYGEVNGQRCIKECSSKVSYKFRCMNQCPSSTYLLNQTCLDRCPTSHSLIYRERKQWERIPAKCVDVCPPTLVNESNVCVDDCSSNKNLFNGSCFNTCPTSHSLLVKDMDWPSSYRGIRTCVDECPSSRVNESNVCVDHCSRNKLLFNGSCYSKCPSSHSTILVDGDKSSCVSTCPINMVPRNNLCSLCPERSPYYLNGTCVELCPPGTYKQEELMRTYKKKACVEYCLEDHVYKDGTCIYKSTCTGLNMFIYDKKECVTDCPFGYLFTYGKDCVEYTPGLVITACVLLTVVLIFAAQYMFQFYDICDNKPRQKWTPGRVPRVEQEMEHLISPSVFVKSGDRGTKDDVRVLLEDELANSGSELHSVGIEGATYGNECEIDEETGRKVVVKSTGDCRDLEEGSTNRPHHLENNILFDSDNEPDEKITLRHPRDTNHILEEGCSFEHSSDNLPVFQFTLNDGNDVQRVTNHPERVHPVHKGRSTGSPTDMTRVQNTPCDAIKLLHNVDPSEILSESKCISLETFYRSEMSHFSRCATPDAESEYSIDSDTELKTVKQ